MFGLSAMDSRPAACFGVVDRSVECRRHVIIAQAKILLRRRNPRIAMMGFRAKSVVFFSVAIGSPMSLRAADKQDRGLPGA